MLLRFGSQEPSSSFFQSRRNTSYAGHSPADYDGTRRVAVTTYYVVDTQEVPRVRLHREETLRSSIRYATNSISTPEVPLLTLSG